MADRPLRPATDRRLGRLLPHQLANRPQAHPKAALRKGPLLSPLHQKEPMRACRRFLAGIPHFRPGHPCVTHPSATPSLTEARKNVRLACVRHAASVYPEPGSNSPSVVYVSTCSPKGDQMAMSSVFESRSRPSCFTIALGCSQIHACTLWESTSLILDRNCCGRLRVSPVAVLLSTLQLSRYLNEQLFRSFASTQVLLHTSGALSRA